MFAITFSPMHATHPFRFILLDLIISITFWEGDKSCSSSLRIILQLLHLSRVQLAHCYYIQQNKIIILGVLIWPLLQFFIKIGNFKWELNILIAKWSTAHNLTAIYEPIV
jgi:hypothetical protein